MRILLIEDDKLIGDGIKTGLGKMGFTIDWFTEGKEGKIALYSAPYDAVILDLTLPGMDGLVFQCVYYDQPTFYTNHAARFFSPQRLRYQSQPHPVHQL